MERGRGYAWLRISEVANIASGNWRFSLCRGSDAAYLGRTGWQNSEDFTEPETYAIDGDDLILHIGPDVVNRLDTNENYRIALQSVGERPQAATFAITTLNRTLMDAQGKISAGGVKKSLETPPQPAPIPVPVQESEPQVELESTPPPQTTKKSPLPIILAALLVLALLGGGAAYWFIFSKGGKPEIQETAAQKPVEKPEAKEDKPQQTASPEPAKPSEKEPEPKVDKPQETASPEPVKPPAKEPEPTAAPPPPPASTRVQVNQYLGGNPTAQGARDLAAKLPQSSAEDQDALYRLWYFASDAGDALASLHLARAVDPALPAWGSIRKNGAEAWKLYAKAAPQQPEAAQAMHTLKQWMEKEAEKGNRDATSWIKKIADDSAKNK